jgi:hypothetical protein
MKKLFFLFLISMVLGRNAATGQAATATISTIVSCDNLEVVVPLNIQNFTNVGAMTLFIGYDTTQLTFQSLENIHPSFQGIFYNVMTVPRTQIAVSYSNMAGVTVVAGKLFDMKFMFKTTATALVFNQGCDLVNTYFQNIPVLYTNGGVNPLINITAQPQNQNVYQPQRASFTVTSSGGLFFQWQISSNGGFSFSNLGNSAVYQGVNSGTLSILTTNSFLNGKLYRCVITNGSCVKNSNNALLTVLEYINQTVPLSVGWNSLSSYLNPVNTNLDNLFSALGTALVIVLSDDKIYYPAGGTNTIGAFDPTKGYALKINRNQNFTISGSPLESKSLTLPAGWSYLPVIVNCNVAISTLFNGVISEVDIIEELPGINVFWPEKGISTLQTLQPGKSYKIKLKSSVTITFPSCNHFEE